MLLDEFTKLHVLSCSECTVHVVLLEVCECDVPCRGIHACTTTSTVRRDRTVVHHVQQHIVIIDASKLSLCHLHQDWQEYIVTSYYM